MIAAKALVAAVAQAATQAVSLGALHGNAQLVAEIIGGAATAALVFLTPNVQPKGA